ncbi:MAG: SDR family oxidoreductase [Bacteroidota bacterium]
MASMAKYLLSPEAAWVTGQVFHIDGGMSSLK